MQLITALLVWLCCSHHCLISACCGFCGVNDCGGAAAAIVGFGCGGAGSGVVATVLSPGQTRYLPNTHPNCLLFCLIKTHWATRRSTSTVTPFSKVAITWPFPCSRTLSGG